LPQASQSALDIVQKYRKIGAAAAADPADAR
jgi:hypothetical protein